MIKKAIRILKDGGLIIFIEKCFKFFFRKVKFLLFYLLSFYRFVKIKDSSFENINELVDFAFGPSAKIIQPAQQKDEIAQLLRILKEISPKVILEIGTAQGGTLYLFSKIADPKAILISIDLPKGKFGGGYPKWKIPLYKSFAKKNQKIYLIRGDSHHQGTLEKVNKILNGRKLDFLFIDGDHTYEGVKKDFEMYSSLVKSDTIIAFHDIVVHPLETGCEVSRFWSEIKGRYNYIEIIKDQNQNWAGIGLLFIK